MAKMDVLQEVKNRMKNYQDGKKEQLEKIRQMQGDARNKIEVAALSMRQATEIMNVEAYEEAKQAKHKAQTALDMYNARYDQIRKQEYISEAESDEVINSLLEYEEQLAVVFKQDLSERLEELKALHKNYVDTVRDIEGTITSWHQNIHANYQSRGLTTWTDPETGETTTRSPKPIPVHQIPYQGCKEAEELGVYLNKATV